MIKTFDDMIRAGELTNAARFMAKEYYDLGKMGHTRKLLIEELARIVDNAKKSWVPVSIQLPDCGNKYKEVDVLVHMDDGFITTATYSALEGFETWLDSGEVTHWMNLPEPPEVEE